MHKKFICGVERGKIGISTCSAARKGGKEEAIVGELVIPVLERRGGMGKELLQKLVRTVTKSPSTINILC